MLLTNPLIPHDQISRVKYQSDGSIAGMTKNFVPLEKSSEFPRRLYGAQPFNPSRDQPIRYMATAGPIDPEIDYLVYSERDDHPAHHSRFGYPWCPNGYCTANFPGRYNTAPAFMAADNAQPPDMAPSRFYCGKWQDQNYNSSDAYNDSFAIRQRR
jgi:hypothetical protein